MLSQSVSMHADHRQAQQQNQVLAFRIEHSDFLEHDRDEFDEKVKAEMQNSLFLKRQRGRVDTGRPRSDLSDNHFAMMHNQSRDGVRLGSLGSLSDMADDGATNCIDPGLRDYLLSQLRDARIDFADLNYEFGEFLIGYSIDRFGSLTKSFEELVELFADLGGECDSVQAEATLRHIQQFDPPGVGARDEAERLGVLVDRVSNDPDLADHFDPPLRHLDELRVLVDHLAFLKQTELGDQTGITEAVARLGISEFSLRRALDELQRVLRLNPFDGYAVASTEFIAPDIIFHVFDDRITHEVKGAVFATVSLPKAYQTDHASRRWLNRSTGLARAAQTASAINGRFEMLDSIALALIELQAEFIRHGKPYLKPLLQKTLARAIDKDDSTISRALNGKLIETPHGIFPIKECFPKEVKPGSGVTEHQLRNFIATVIATEPTHSPFSDKEIRAEVKRRFEILVARETVKEHRKKSNIPCSRDRKRRRPKVSA